MSAEPTLIRLRPFMRDDRTVTLTWRNTPQIRDSVMGFRYPVSDVMEDHWFDKVLDGSNKSQVYFAIETIDDSHLIGFCSLTDIDYQSSNAQFGIMIGEVDSQRKGIGSQALDSTLAFAFDSLNLQRIYVLVRAKNRAAIKLFSGRAFSSEGTMRQHYFINGAYDDVLIMALLKSERIHSR